MSDIVIHPSSLSMTQGRCGHWLDLRPGADVPTVAKWIGTCVHANITGVEDPPPPPERMLFDSHSPTLRHAHRDIKRLTEQGLALLKGFPVLEREPQRAEAFLENPTVLVEGRPDFIIGANGRRWGVLDMKTGSRPPVHAWSQVAAYAWLFRDLGLEVGGVMWLPRVRGSSNHRPRVEWRPIGDLEVAGEALLEAEANRLSNPPCFLPDARWCGSCAHQKNECAVAAVER